MQAHVASKKQKQTNYCSAASRQDGEQEKKARGMNAGLQQRQSLQCRTVLLN